MAEDERKTNEQEENEKAGKLSGIGAGVITGAAIGSTIMPIVGTFAGALVGGVVGSEVGKKVGGSLLNRFANKDKKDVVTGATADLTAELQKLAELHEAGALDDDEFKSAKAKLLGL